MERVLRTSSGWVIVVAMAPWFGNGQSGPRHGTHRASAGSEVGDQVVREVVGGEEHSLDLVVETQLANGHQDGSGTRMLGHNF